MSIRLIDINNNAMAYQKLNEKLQPSVFNSTAWLKMFSALNLYGIFNDNNELIGSFYFLPL